MVVEADSNLTLLQSLPFWWGAATDVGREREENEDTFLVEPEIGLFLVSDGMGGHRGGALASKIVAEDLSVLIETRLGKLKSESTRAIRAMFKKAISQQSSHLRMEADSESGYKGMGATLALALLRNCRAYIANIGDSRVYRLRKGHFVQLSRDHSVVSELLEKGKIEPDEAEDHSAQGEITRYMGMEEKAKPFVRTFELKKNDCLLLCTDGLTDMVDEKEIAAYLKEHSDPQKVCNALIETANSAGGHDNITVIVINQDK